MKKKIGYWIYAFFFSVFRLFPRKKEKVFCVMTHDGSAGSSVGIVVNALKKRSDKYQFIYMKKNDRENAKAHVVKAFYSFFIEKPYHMATSSYILMDNVFLPMAYLHFHKDVKVVQLWHGTGTIKKFGLDAENGEVARLARKANRRITHLIVNSERTRRQYQSAFGIPDEKIYMLGLPRTDRMLDKEWLEKKRRNFFSEYPELQAKRIILYAPTFRDQEVEKPYIALDLSRMAEELSEDEVTTFSIDSLILLSCSPIVLDCVEEVSESFLISSATTENPLPASPA